MGNLGEADHLLRPPNDRHTRLHEQSWAAPDRLPLSLCGDLCMSDGVVHLTIVLSFCGTYSNPVPVQPLEAAGFCKGDDWASGLYRLDQCTEAQGVARHQQESRHHMKQKIFFL